MVRGKFKGRLEECVSLSLSLSQISALLGITLEFSPVARNKCNFEQIYSLYHLIGSSLAVLCNFINTLGRNLQWNMSVSLARLTVIAATASVLLSVIRIKRIFGIRRQPNLAPKARNERRSVLVSLLPFLRLSFSLSPFSYDHYFFNSAVVHRSLTPMLCSGQSSCRESFRNFHNYVRLNTRNQIA